MTGRAGREPMLRIAVVLATFGTDTRIGDALPPVTEFRGRYSGGRRALNRVSPAAVLPPACRNPPRRANKRGRRDTTTTTNSQDAGHLSTALHNRTPALRRQRTNALSFHYQPYRGLSSPAASRPRLIHRSKRCRRRCVDQTTYPHKPSVFNPRPNPPSLRRKRMERRRKADHTRWMILSRPHRPCRKSIITINYSLFKCIQNKSRLHG